MKLKIKRYQKKAGMISKEVVFCLDVQSEHTTEELFAINEYKLGGQVIYNSEASQKHLNKTRASLESGGLLSGVASLAMAKLSLNITIDSLKKGQTIECKNLDEALAAEEAIKLACENLKGYLLIAQSFNGKVEELVY